MKKILFALLIMVLVMSMIGCNNEKEYIKILRGEGEYWEVEFAFTEDMKNYDYILSFKGDDEDLMQIENIRIGYFWFHKDAELIVDKNQQESLAELILNNDTHSLSEIIEFSGDDSEAIKLYSIKVSDGDAIAQLERDGQVKESGIMTESEQEAMSSNIHFAIKWGENTEGFKVD